MSGRGGEERPDSLHQRVHGIPGPPGAGKTRFILCWQQDFSDAQLDALKRASGAETLCVGDWIGRDYISVHWSEYGKRRAVLTAMLRMGLSFQTQTKGMIPFDPVVVSEFTYEALERNVIAQCRSLCDLRLFYMVNDAMCEEWNYVTQEGKAFARELRAGPMQHRYDTSRTNYFDWDVMKHYDPETLLSVEPVSSSSSQTTTTTTCMICMDREADTMVLPCEHNVVCRTCSSQLERTPDAHICVQCRRPIQYKLC